MVELLNEFSKVVGCKINAQKTVAFLYTTKKYHKEKLRKTCHLQLHQRRKYIWINLTKDVKDLYSENCKY